MELTGEIKDLSKDYKTDKPILQLVLNERDCLLSLEQLKDIKLSIQVKKWRKRRFRIEDKDKKTFEIMWQDKGIAWFCETADTEYIGDIEFKIINAYYGSSSFNSKQMSRLINDLVEDCKEVGIETKSDAEIKSLLESWDKQ